jgi:hypothetical protein
MKSAAALIGFGPAATIRSMFAVALGFARQL